MDEAVSIPPSRPGRTLDLREDGLPESERSVPRFDPYFSRLFTDGDRLVGVSDEDDRLWAGY